MIFWTPTARCSLSWATHSSTEPMIALSLEQSLLAGKSHSLFSQSSISVRTASFDRPTMIGNCEALSSLSCFVAVAFGGRPNLVPRLRGGGGLEKMGEPPTPRRAGALEYAVDVTADQQRHARFLGRLRIHHGGGNIVRRVLAVDLVF